MIKTPHRIMYDALGPDRRDVYWKFCRAIDATPGTYDGLAYILRQMPAGNHESAGAILSDAFSWSATPENYLYWSPVWHQLIRESKQA